MKMVNYLVCLFLILLVTAPGALAETASEPDNATRLFAVRVTVGPNWDDAKETHEQAFFGEHSAHLSKLRKAGIIVMGARYADVGLLIFSASSVEAVDEMMAADPSMQAGTFQYDVHPFNVFYPGTLE